MICRGRKIIHDLYTEVAVIPDLGRRGGTIALGRERGVRAVLFGQFDHFEFGLLLRGGVCVIPVVPAQRAADLHVGRGLRGRVDGGIERGVGGPGHDVIAVQQRGLTA